MVSARDRYLQRNYSLTEEEWNAVLLLQGGGCAGCGARGVTRSLHTDHDHRTLATRGILCVHCNSALRKVLDRPEVLEALAAYLRNPPVEQLFGYRVAVNRARKRRRRKR